MASWNQAGDRVICKKIAFKVPQGNPYKQQAAYTQGGGCLLRLHSTSHQERNVLFKGLQTFSVFFETESDDVALLG